MSKKVIHLLCGDADRAALQPVLDALRAKGLRVSGEVPGKNDLVLAALSETFYADKGKTEALLALVAAGAENVLPLQLDGTPIPDTIKNALYARNIIPAAERDAAHTAERIVDALPKQKSRLPLLLTAAALVLIAAVGLLVWRGMQKEEALPVMAEITPEPLYIPAGVTEEELAAIEDVVIVGDYFGYFTDADFREAGENWLDVYWVAYDAWDEDGNHWYSKEDGQEYAMTRYDDLRFLERMPKLRFLTLVNVEAQAAALPDLSGAALLESVSLRKCNIDSLEWLRGARLNSFDAQLTQITDYSPLSDCERLQHAWIDLYHAAELSAFAPPQLQYLRLENGEDYGETDLSGLAACEKLSTVELGELSLRDLDFLRDKPIYRLELWGMDMLRDISALESLKKLKELEIKYCPGVRDYTPIAGCTALEYIHVQGDENPDALHDASFLAELPNLRDIGLYSCNLYNMDFLEGIAERQSSMSLGFAGDIQDYSGLAYIKNYDYLHVNPRYQNGGRGGDFSAVLPYIQDAKIDNLMLYACAGVDLSELPDSIHELSIRYGDLRDLGGLKPYSLRRLELWDCQYLTSLSGIEAIPTLFGDRGQMELEIAGCPRLMDYAALEGAYLETLKLTGIYTLPEMTAFRKANNLCLESIDGISDLRFLSGLNGGEGCNLSLVGLDELYDLTPLRDLGGDHLTVPPQAAEQAEELVEDGIYGDFEVAYPDGSWQPFEGAVELLSLDELDTLPKALLKRVESVALVGDTLLDWNRYEVWEDWDAMDWQDENAQPGLILYDRETGEESPVALGFVTDLSIFSELTGLRELCLYAQPLESLDGVQALESLEELELMMSPHLTDASAAFALPELRVLRLRDSAVTSIQGVQNLRELCFLDIFHTRVADLTPLTGCDFTTASEQGGFQLDTADLPCEDFSPLASIPEYRFLCLNNMDSTLWAPALEGCVVHRFGATGAGWTNESFAAFVGQHPELEEIEVSWSMELTDLTPLLQLEKLTLVHLNRQMEAAIDSLSGQELRFELRIDD